MATRARSSVAALLLPLAALLLSVAFPLAGCGGGEAEAPNPAEAPRTSAEAQARAQAEARRSLVPDDPRPAPDLALTTLGGDTLNLAQPEGRVRLVNFWATWCPPCLKEIPDLKTLHEDLGARGFEVVGVAMDQEGAEAVVPFVRARQMRYPIVLDSTGRVAEQFGRVRGLPTSFVVGPNGTVRRVILGLVRASDVRDELVALLEEADLEEAEGGGA
jgi:peroxiredoxin